MGMLGNLEITGGNKGNYAMITKTTNSTMISGNSMAGICDGISAITPVSTGVLLITLSFTQDSFTGGTALYRLRYGTGTGPAATALDTGTQIGIDFTIDKDTVERPVALTGILTGLTLGTAYWIDLSGTPSTGSIIGDDFTLTIIEYVG